jgi:hypothetical protein
MTTILIDSDIASAATLQGSTPENAPTELSGTARGIVEVDVAAA